MIHNPFDKIWKFSVPKYDSMYTSDRKTLFDIFSTLQSWEGLDTVPYTTFLPTLSKLLLTGEASIKIRYSDYRIYVDNRELNDEVKPVAA